MRRLREVFELSNPYRTFLAMILTAMGAMYALTYLNTYQLDHVEWSETRIYMTLLMGASMAAVMLAFMRGMYANRRLNALIVAGSALLFALAIWLVRSQSTVQDVAYMKGMIPHHSIAILTSERAEIEDIRVRDLADGIIDAQRREIQEMKWLIDDIRNNGPAQTREQAEQRETPAFAASEH